MTEVANIVEEIAQMSNQQLNARLAIVGDMAIELRQELRALTELENAIRSEMARRSGQLTAGEST